MESFTPEKLSETPDFASEKIPYKVFISSDASKDFPIISDTEMISHQEKYVNIIGVWEIKEGKIVIKVESILEIQDDPLTVFNDPDGHTVIADLGKIEEIFEEVKAQDHTLVGRVILGDIHTHPYTEEELGRKVYLPSLEDNENMIKHYKSGSVGKQSPYFFGITVRNKEKEMQIAFYRVIWDGDSFKVIPLNDYQFQ